MMGVPSFIHFLFKKKVSNISNNKSKKQLMANNSTINTNSNSNPLYNWGTIGMSPSRMTTNLSNLNSTISYDPSTYTTYMTTDPVSSTYTTCINSKSMSTLLWSIYAKYNFYFEGQDMYITSLESFNRFERFLKAKKKGGYLLNALITNKVNSIIMDVINIVHKKTLEGDVLMLDSESITEFNKEQNFLNYIVSEANKNEAIYIFNASQRKAVIPKIREIAKIGELIATEDEANYNIAIGLLESLI